MLSRFALHTRQTFSFVRRASTTPNLLVFPRQEEGNEYAVNWSLVEDGVTSTGNSFRNGRNQLLQTRLKSANLKPFSGKFVVEEAGHEVGQDDFNCILSDAQSVLSNSDELFIEDGFIGSQQDSRIGVRLISNDASDALFLRKLLVPSAPFTVNPRARCNGWNQDKRWKDMKKHTWTGGNYEELPKIYERGQRPIVVYRGLTGNRVMVQFIQNAEEIVGANVVVGSDAPMKAVMESAGYAAAVVNNENSPVLHIPCGVVFNGTKSALLLNASDDVFSALHAKNILYSAYNSAISSRGVSAIWNSVALQRPLAQNSESLCELAAIDPDNMIPLPSRIFAISSSKFDLSDVVDALSAVTNEKSKASLEALLSNMSIDVVDSVDQIEVLLK